MDIPNVKSTKESLPFTVDPIGFENKINYAALYHLYMQKLNDIHASEGVINSITYYNTMVVPSFGGMFDEIYLKNCVEIIEDNDDFNSIYMLHKVELNRLMTRIGIAPKPDIRIRYEGSWDVPESLNGMSFDGKNKTSKTKEQKPICVWMRKKVSDNDE
jgi:hypothetical protein